MHPQWEQHIIGPFNSPGEIVEFRLAVEEAGRQGFEIVGITSAAGQLYAAVKRVKPPRPVSRGNVVTG